MKKIILSISLLSAMTGVVYAQTNTFPTTGSAGIGTITPNGSAILEMQSTTKGMLAPRMTKNQRDAIASPAEGLMIYQTNNTPGFYYYDGADWKAVTSKGANKSLSNLTTPTAVNVDLLPNADNIISLGSSSVSWKDLFLDGHLYLGGARFLTYQTGTGTGNTAVGSAVLNANTTGSSNTGTGFNVLYANTTGNENTANGYQVLYANTSGYGNTANGYKSLYYNTTGYDNTANGHFAMNENTTGVANTADGHSALSANTTGGFNTAIGGAALNSNTTGSSNVALGYVALYANTTGSYNTAIGRNACYQNNTGSNNSANGYQALRYNTTGNSNTAMGAKALYFNTDRSNLVAIGDSALYNNGTGVTYSSEATANTAVGSKALFANTTGRENTASGFQSLTSNVTGYNNTAFGSKALEDNTTGYINTAIGSYALSTNTTGYENSAVGYLALSDNTTGNINTATGSQSLVRNTTGNYNTANGGRTLLYNTTGEKNTVIGNNAMYYNTTGAGNTANGYSAGSYNDNNTNCTFLGYDADQSVTTDFTNSMALGNGSRITASNQVRVGNSSVTSIGGYASWTNISDGRIKKNIKENVPGLEFINRLKPVTYNLNVTDIRSFLKEEISSEENDRENKNIHDKSKELIEQGIKEKEKILYTGFVAQDVEAVAKKLNYDFSGVDKPQDENGLYGLRYSEFVVPLVKAVQELSQKNDEKDKKLNDLQKQIDDLKLMFKTSQQPIAANEASSLQSVKLGSTFRLEQNYPNPFTNTTTITCVLPVNSGKAFINFYSQGGALLKSVKINGTGKTSTSLKENELAAGTYTYTLVVDGKMIDSKKMILIK